MAHPSNSVPPMSGALALRGPARLPASSFLHLEYKTWGTIVKAALKILLPERLVISAEIDYLLAEHAKKSAKNRELAGARSPGS